MKRRIWQSIIGLVVLVVAVAVSIYCTEISNLNRARVYLESEYQSAFSTIETHASDPALERYDSLEDADRKKAIRDEIERALSSDAAYSARWSLDGYHGLEGLCGSRA